MSFYAEYTASCSYGTCGGERNFEQAASAGLKLGDTVPKDPSNPLFGRCPRCQRYQMTVTRVPEEQTKPGPKGFSKIPTE